ncbi:MAG: esterase family protein [Alicyclobacillus sp.]|nr:esterase family protein [Alicyclobacillus sp.]
MAPIHCYFFSEVLGLSTSMTVILPQQTSRQIGMQSAAVRDKHPTLYLLHGLSDDDTIWLRRTSIERYVAPLGLAVVMPQVHRSFYTDMVYGGQYWTLVSEELPAIARSFFPLSDAREDNFVAGLSMGGYGAFKLALRHPQRFAAAASLSGALNIGNPDFSLPDARFIFGDKPVAGTDNDLLWLLQNLGPSSGPMPKLYQCCGTEDFLYEGNLAFRDACRKANYPSHVYEEGPGSHTWSYWDEHIQNALAFFFRDRK